jgi:pilus assembly protein CpaB
VNKSPQSDDEKQTEKVEVAMVKSSLPAGTVITLELINKETVTKDELPEGELAMTSSLQVLGRVLRVPVVEGQVLTESCFVKEGIGAMLASHIPHGMRAVTVIITSKIMPDAILLYPGCVVDVLVSYKLLNRDNEGEAISQTMLVGIHVLAISGDSVVSRPEEEGANKRRSSRGRLVTLLVTPRQAEALSLAIENGRISLSIRNPLDKKIIGKLQPLPDFRIGPGKDFISQRHQTAVVPIRQNQRWEVTVIRGRKVQRIHSEPDSSRQLLGLSSLSATDENRDKWILDLVKRQPLSSLEGSGAKPGPPLLVKTDVQISGRNISINLIVEGQAGEKYAVGIRKNRQRQPAPGFNIVDEAGKVLTSGKFKYG